MVAGASLWCLILLVAAGCVGFAWLAGAFALLTLMAVLLNRAPAAAALGAVSGAGAPEAAGPS